MHTFNVIFKQLVEREVNREVYARDEAEALGMAREFLKNGDGVNEVIVSEVVERNMMLDEEVDVDLMRAADSHSRLPGH